MRSHRGLVTKYIHMQAEHHKAVSYQDVFRELLRRHGLEWDERYLWE